MPSEWLSHAVSLRMVLVLTSYLCPVDQVVFSLRLRKQFIFQLYTCIDRYIRLNVFLLENTVDV
jgi:hypothetical protein